MQRKVYIVDKLAIYAYLVHILVIYKIEYANKYK